MTRGPGNEPAEWLVLDGRNRGGVITNDDPRQLFHANEMVNFRKRLYQLHPDGTATDAGPVDRGHRTWGP